MTINASSITSLIALLFYVVLFFAVLKRGLKRREDQFFALYLLSMIIWSFGAFMMFFNLDIGTTLFWNRFMVVGSMGMPIALFGFAQTFLIKSRRNFLILGIVLYLIIQAINLRGYVVQGAYVTDGLLYNEYGPGIYLISAIWVFYIGLLGYDLIQAYNQSKDSLYRNLIKYLLTVVFLTLAGAITNGTVLQVFPVDIAFNALSALIITYAIFRHNLLDFSFVFRKGLLYSIPTIILGAGYFLVVSLALNIFYISGSQFYILSFIVAIVIALVAQPFYEKAQYWIDILFYRDKYDTSLMLQRISTAASVLDLDRLSNLILDEITSTLHIKNGAFFTLTDDRSKYIIIAQRNIGQDTSISLENRNSIVIWLIRHKKILTRSEMEVMPQLKGLWDRERESLAVISAEIYIPLLVSDNLVGILVLGPKLSDEIYSYDDLLSLTTLANQTAVAIEKARLFKVVQQELAERERAEKQLQLQLQRMNALRSIDISIVNTYMLDASLDVLLEQVITQLEVDAAAVLLLNSNEKTLNYRASTGFRTTKVEDKKLNVGEGLAGQAAEKQAILSIPDVLEMEATLETSAMLRAEEFIAYYGIPIVAKGDVKGVLEVYHRSRLNPDQEWLDFMDTLAREAAIVVDNISLFQELQQSNLELEIAYETTLEGWARALELRDNQTVGHSRRVTDMTILLAKSLGVVDEEELTNIRRGALLHDIGKMGVPDELLLKPGPLSPEEFELMAQHPIYAYEMLSSIPYLIPALDIPYYHHEKWDGTGYPLGLKGEQIPLAARIFAVIDVWDALISERPYRPAWSVEDATIYIKDQSNSHFDPRVVDAFLQLVDDLMGLHTLPIKSCDKTCG
jgi:HD-GYP domain-containing protein (c-di-GMP phosphodiesterase class II)